MVSASDDADVIVIGGGFYGACVALFMRSIADRVLIVEREDKRQTIIGALSEIHEGFL